GAVETPYVRLAGVVTVAVVVTFYSWVVNRLSRVGVVRWAHLIFAATLLLFWIALRLWGTWLGAMRPFVWAVYILVELYSVVLIGIFWTYTNDICDETESNKLYGVIGVGGILGGAAGGAFVDGFTRMVGPVNLLLICAGLCAVSAGLGSLTEALVHPPKRRIAPEKKEEEGLATALEGAREVAASHYLMLIVGIVVAYEFTATLTDFGISVVFERTYHDEILLTKMYGRLGWIVSATALVSQLVLVPLLLPHKRIALLVPPIVMLSGAVSVMVLPVIATAMFLAASDRGLNYSVQQATKESLYVPLTDVQKYKSKAFIDMFVDRAAKALAAFALIAIIQAVGASVGVSLGVSVLSMVVWAFAAWRLGSYWNRSGFAGKPEPLRISRPHSHPSLHSSS
ncbi:MAG: Npt1/Npt2 family nucleotide transporter, partial [Polyangiales bacterium]